MLLSSTDLVMHLDFHKKIQMKRNRLLLCGVIPCSRIYEDTKLSFQYKDAYNRTHTSGWSAGVCQLERCRESRKCCKRHQDVYNLKWNIYGLSSKIQYLPFLNERREFMHSCPLHTHWGHGLEPLTEVVSRLDAFSFVSSLFIQDQGDYYSTCDVNENLWPVTFGLQNRPKISSKCCFQFCLPWMTAGKDGLLMLPWVNSFLLQRFPFRLHYVILLIAWKALRTQHHLEHAFLVLQTGSQFWCLFSRLSKLGLMFLTNNTSEQLRKTFKCTREA